MIKSWSATSFVVLELLWCVTGTKFDAWTSSSGHPPNRPDKPYVHTYDLQPPPIPKPFPKPSLPKPPPHPGPLYPPDHVSPPDKPYMHSYDLQPPPIPKPFPKPSLPKPPPHPGPPYPHDPVSPPYVPGWSNLLLSNSETPNVHSWPFLQVPPSQNPPPPQKPPSGDPHNPLGSGPYTLEPPDHIMRTSWYSTSHPVPHNPVSLPFNPPVLNPPNPKLPKEPPRVPFLYYDVMPPLRTPSLPGPPGLPGYQRPSSPASYPKPGARPPKKLPSNSPPVAAFPSFSQLPEGYNYSNRKHKNMLPRGFPTHYYYQEPRPQQPWKEPPVHHYPPSVKDPNLQDCDVTRIQRIRCGSPDISAAACEAISCCHDGHNCYFGKSVTVQCTKDAQFIVVVARDATIPNIDINTVSLMADGPGCTQVDSNSAFSIYQFPVTACGSVIMEEAGKIIYENRMTTSYEISVGPLGAITRDSSYELLFQCIYTAHSVETLIAEMIPLQNPPLPVAALGPINVQLRLGNGQCLTKGCNEEEVAYSSFYTDADYPVRKVLRDNVYVEVQLMDRTDPNLVLTLGRCWTTTSPNPHSMPQWDIIINGCPNIDDRYAAVRVPVGPGSGVDFPSHYRRFIFRMFTFVETSTLSPQSEHVYIHCTTSVCNAASGHSCEPLCYRRRRDVTTVAQTKKETKIVVSTGLLLVNKP